MKWKKSTDSTGTDFWKLDKLPIKHLVPKERFDETRMWYSQMFFEKSITPNQFAFGRCGKKYCVLYRRRIFRNLIPWFFSFRIHGSYTRARRVDSNNSWIFREKADLNSGRTIFFPSDSWILHITKLRLKISERVVIFFSRTIPKLKQRCG